MTLDWRPAERLADLPQFGVKKHGHFWFLVDMDDGAQLGPGDHASKGACIAYAHERVRDQATVIGASSEEVATNACLIAVAPDMLRLLKRVAPYMKTVSRSGHYGYETNDPTLYEDILYAIAKAEGLTD